MVKQKILKIKVGEVYIDKKNYPVYQTAWKQEGKNYYVLSNVIFPGEIEKKDKIKEESVNEDI